MTSQDDERWMTLAVELAGKCPPSDSAYSVGAVIVGRDGIEIARGYSREDDPKVHAEESALAKLDPGDPRLAGATIYSTLEPCSQRKSRPRTCTQLILATGIARVVIAWREPDLFVADCQGCELLAQAGRTVDELPRFAERAMAPNRHLRRLSVALSGAGHDAAAVSAARKLLTAGESPAGAVASRTSVSSAKTRAERVSVPIARARMASSAAWSCSPARARARASRAR
jgi:diaminohydroxyphosphoribosylaminopyrimidine deaminase / 5-amino-6-(5-phosphoribosylamino)uracil reductase